MIKKIKQKRLTTEKLAEIMRKSFEDNWSLSNKKEKKDIIKTYKKSPFKILDRDFVLEKIFKKFTSLGNEERQNIINEVYLAFDCFYNYALVYHDLIDSEDGDRFIFDCYPIELEGDNEYVGEILHLVIYREKIYFTQKHEVSLLNNDKEDIKKWREYRNK